MEELKFIQSIVEDAKQEAVQIETEAKLLSARQIDVARKELEVSRTKAVSAAVAGAELVKARAEMAAGVENGKVAINQKQEALNAVFESAKAEVAGEPSVETKKLVSALVKKFANAGDTVLISKKDEKVLTDEFFKTLPVKNLKVKVSSKVKAGIILSGATFDTDLTLDTLFVEIANEKILEVSKILFA